MKVVKKKWIPWSLKAGWESGREYLVALVCRRANVWSLLRAVSELCARVVFLWRCGRVSFALSDDWCWILLSTLSFSSRKERSS